MFGSQQQATTATGAAKKVLQVVSHTILALLSFLQRIFKTIL